MLLISFSYLIELAMSSSATFNKRDIAGTLSLLTILKGMLSMSIKNSVCCRFVTFYFDTISNLQKIERIV